MTLKPKVIVLSGYGLNSELETLQGFLDSGATGEIIHINDLISNDKKLSDYQIMTFPGGFAYGDDTGAGNAYANRLKNNLWDEVYKFATADKLIIGICNGAQILANTGLVPALDGNYGDRVIALRHNKTARYECRWVDLQVNQNNKCVWTQGLDYLHIVVSHGEGNFYAEPEVLNKIKEKKLIVAQYVKPDGADAVRQASRPVGHETYVLADGEFPYNPNGALDDIAAISDESGRMLLIMPHPERAMYFTQLDNWPLLKEQYLRAGKKLPKKTDNMQIFRNAVQYFTNS